MNAPSTLVPIVAELLGKATGLPAHEAPDVYTGPPSTPCIVVRAVGPETVDPYAGTVSGQVLAAIYGGTVDLAEMVEDGRGHVRDEHRETAHGTLGRLQIATPTDGVLPNGMRVLSLPLTVTAHALRPVLDVATVGSSEAQAFIGGVAAGVERRFGSGPIAFGTARAGVTEFEVTEPGVVRITGEVMVYPGAGRRLADFDVAAMVAAAVAERVGKPSTFGRITSGRVLETEAVHDARRVSTRSHVELVAEYVPA